MQEFFANPGHFLAVNQAWIVGFIITSVSSYTRFNIPSNSRSLTTWLRYHTVALIYAAVTVVGWIMLATTPELLSSIPPEVKETVEHEVSQHGLIQSTLQLAAPLYAALVLTALVSSYEPFRRADEKLRTFFHDMARIPREAKRLSAALRDKTWLPNSELQDQVRAALKDADFNDDEISFSDDDTPQARWTKISTIHYHLKRWQSGEQRRFVDFYHQHLTEFQKLSLEYDGLAAAARKLFRLLDVLRSMPHDPKLVEVQEELIRRFLVEAERLEESICDLASRALLKCALTANARREELETMGFVVNVNPNPIFDRILLLYVVLTALYIGSLKFAGRPRPELTGAIIGINYVGAVLSAIYPKQWPWARPTEAGRPIRGYMFSAFLAIVLALVASLGMGVLLTWDVKEAGKLLWERWWPWSFMAAMAAAATAYNIDNDEWPRRRWFEAALQALVGIGGALLVYVWLRDLCQIYSQNCPPPNPYRVVFMAALSGGLIGWLVPTWYRHPQIMKIKYKQHKVIVEVIILPSENAKATIQITHLHKRDGLPSAQVIPFEEEFRSADEALAKAVAYAWRQIDIELEGTGRARLSAAYNKLEYTEA